jgi:hypothetical protein
VLSEPELVAEIKAAIAAKTIGGLVLEEQEQEQAQQQAQAGQAAAAAAAAAEPLSVGSLVRVAWYCAAHRFARPIVISASSSTAHLSVVAALLWQS